MLRADRNAAMLAGLLCAPRVIKGMGYVEGIKSKGGKVLTPDDFDEYNRQDAPAPEELTVDRVKRMLAGNR